MAGNLGRIEPRTPMGTKSQSVPDPSQRQVLIECQIPSKIINEKNKTQKPTAKGPSEFNKRYKAT